MTQAPLNNTIEDFWNMVSQYDIGTVVMLNNSKEGKEVDCILPNIYFMSSC